MSLVAAAAGVGDTVSGMILKFSKNEYETKITTLEGYAQQLEQHLSRLESLKGRVGEFWKDEKAAEYVNILTTQILEVRTQLDRVARLKIMYQEISNDMSGAEGKVKGLIDTATSALSKLGE